MSAVLRTQAGQLIFDRYANPIAMMMAGKSSEKGDHKCAANKTTWTTTHIAA